MKRDMELVRQLLLRVEEGQGPSMAELLEKPEEMELYGHHIRILIDAGFLTGIDASSMTSSDWLDLQLTWMGHEFLDTLRDPTTWDKTKKLSKEGRWFELPDTTGNWQINCRRGRQGAAEETWSELKATCII